MRREARLCDLPGFSPPQSFLVEESFSAELCSGISGTLPGLDEIILTSTQERFWMLRARSSKNGLSLTCPGGQGRVEAGLHSCPSLAQRIRARFSKSRDCRSGCWRTWVSGAPAVGRIPFPRRRPQGEPFHVIFQQHLAHTAPKLQITEHTACLGHFAKRRVCFYAEGNAVLRFKVAALVNCCEG